MSQSPPAAADKNATNDQAAPAAKSGGFLIKIMALLFLVAVVLAECLIAYLYLPSNAAASTAEDEVAAEEEPAQEAKEEKGKGEHGKAEGEKSGHGKSEHGKAEKSKSEKPKSGHGKPESKGEHGKTAPSKGGHGKKAETESHEEDEADSPDQVEVDLEKFSVTMHQPTSNTTLRIDFHLFGMVRAEDQEDFSHLMEMNQHRFREQVLMTIRSAEAADLSDAGLGLIKRQISEKTNALLGKPLLRGIIVSEFSYIEQ